VILAVLNWKTALLDNQISEGSGWREREDSVWESSGAGEMLAFVVTNQSEKELNNIEFLTTILERLCVFYIIQEYSTVKLGPYAHVPTARSQHGPSVLALGILSPKHTL